MTGCPSCAAPLPTRNPGIVVAVCEYCGCAVTWDGDAAKDSGVKTRLPQGFTRLYTGAQGALRGNRFRVIGRVRYSWGGGFWDEWALQMDDQGLHWLTEDDHELAMETGKGRLELLKDLSPGQTLRFDNKAFRIEEVGEAECIGLEGQLPKDITLGERYRYADGSTPNGLHTLGLELDEPGSAAVFTGSWLKDKDLELDDEGLEW